RVLHAVPLDAQGEMLAGPHERAVYDEHVLNVLLGENRRAGGHAAQQGDFDGVAGGGDMFGSPFWDRANRRGGAGGNVLDLDPPRGPSVAADFPRLLEAVQVVPHTVRRGNPEGLPDFTDRRRPALLAERPRNHI